MENKNMELYNSLRVVPDKAKKEITGGRLKGMTDIKPIWRIEALTEKFGPVGVGWYYKITDKRIEVFGDEAAAFVDIDLFFKYDGEWSVAVPGTGGSSFVEIERNGPHMSDECFKMALTDAISVAAKALGVGADVYWGDKGDRSKYTVGKDKDDAPDVKNMGIKSIGALVLPFGKKHKGKALGTIYREDKSYLEWLYNSERTDQWLKDAISRLTQAAIETEAKKKQEEL